MQTMPRVLIIEDNPVNLELVAATLELEGHQIVTAETAKVGLRLAAAEQPDPILMDLHLPGIDECKAARALQADPATTAIPVVAITAQAMRGDEQKAREAGCDAYLTKPVDAHALRETLRRLLDRSSA